MPLFEFELARVEEIQPWGEPGAETLSWFALTDGSFRINAGEHTLFRHTDEVLEHWGLGRRDTDYQVAAYARDILGVVSASISPIPEFFERLCADWKVLSQLQTDWQEADDECYSAWRWLGERSPWTSYLVAPPNISFVRVQDEVVIHWDNRKCLADGIPVWTEQVGDSTMWAETFLEECHSFADRLLETMEARVAAIEVGISHPRAAVDIAAARKQHRAWRLEFESYFRPYQPEIRWELAEQAIRAIARKTGVALPV